MGLGVRASTQINNDGVFLELTAGSTMELTGDLYMGSASTKYKIVNMAEPTNPSDAATMNYVDTGLAGKLDTVGDAMTGDLDMGGNQVLNVGDPVDGGDGMNRNYADGRYLRLSVSPVGTEQDVNSVIRMFESIYFDSSGTHPTEMGDPTAAALYLGGFRIEGVADPYEATDAANKRYVDAARQGVDYKESCRVATSSVAGVSYDPATSAPATVDGVSLAVDDRVLLKDHLTPSNNGIYTVGSVGTGSNGSWSRSLDADEDAEVSAGLTTYIEEGTSNADKLYALTTDDPITVGTTSLTFSMISSVAGIDAGSGLSKSGQTLNVNVDGSTTKIDGSDNVAVKINTAALITSDANGVALANGDAGQIIVGASGAGATPAYQTLSGDGALDELGNLTLDPSFLKSSDRVKGESLTGMDGVTEVFTTSANFVAGTEAVYLNGVRLRKGVLTTAVNEYNVTGSNQITLQDPPAADDWMVINFDKA